MDDQKVYQVVGFQWGTFEGKDGRDVPYARLYCVAPFNGHESDTYRFVGGKAHEFKCSSVKLFDNLDVNDKVQLFFNQYGKVNMIQKVK